MTNPINEYIEILDNYIIEKNKEIIISNQNELLVNLESFWVCEYQNILEKMQNESGGLRTFHFGDYLNNFDNLKKTVNRYSLFSDEIVIFDPTPILNVSTKIPCYSKQNQNSITEYLTTIYELKDWIEEGIVTILPSCFFGAHRHCVNLDHENNWKNAVLNEIHEVHSTQRKDDEKVADYTIAIDFLYSSSSYRAIPSTDQKKLWNNIMKKIEFDEKHLNRNSLNLVALEKINLNFLNDVPFDFAKKIRDEGYLSELRHYFGKHFNQIEITPEKSDFDELIKNFSIEINDEINRHEHEWKDIKSEMKRNVAVKSSSLMIAAGIITSASTYGLSIPTWMGILGTVLPAGSGIQDIIEYINKKRKVHRNGVNLLFELKTINDK